MLEEGRDEQELEPFRRVGLGTYIWEIPLYSNGWDDKHTKHKGSRDDDSSAVMPQAKEWFTPPIDSSCCRSYITLAMHCLPRAQTSSGVARQVSGLHVGDQGRSR